MNWPDPRVPEEHWENCASLLDRGLFIHRSWYLTPSGGWCIVPNRNLPEAEMRAPNVRDVFTAATDPEHCFTALVRKLTDLANLEFPHANLNSHSVHRVLEQKDEIFQAPAKWRLGLWKFTRGPLYLGHGIVAYTELADPLELLGQVQELPCE